MDTGTTLFGRVCRVLIVLPPGNSFSDTDPSANSIEITGADGAGTTGLRITGKITKTNQKEPNSGEVCLYNLAPSTRARMQVKGVRLVAEAGYAGTGLLPLFVGDVRTVDHIREGADWKTLFKCGDGERSFRYARAAESFAAGATVGQVLAYCARSMGLALGNTDTQSGVLTKPLYQGWTVSGTASTELDRILRAVGYGYSIQDGVLQILNPNQSVTQQIQELTPETGLIGSPEIGSPTQKGKPQTLKVRSLLMPLARPGGRVHLRSERYNGVFRMLKVTHEFDVRGGPWYSDLETVADGTVAVA